MEIKFLNQPKEVKLGDIFKTRLKEHFSEINIIAGIVKDAGLEDLLESFDVATKSGSVNLYIGIDRKNISKDMLLKVLSAGCKLFLHINSDDSKVESRIYLFENKDSNSYIYISGGKFSESGLFESISTITEIKYDCSLEIDKKAFNTAKNSILQGTVNVFHSADQEEIILLAEKGEIIARITERKIPNISELYGSGTGFGDLSSASSSDEQMYDESTSSFDINLSKLKDIDIDLDLDSTISVRKNVELATEKEAKKELAQKENELKSLSKNESDLNKFYTNSSEEVTKKKSMIHIS